MRPKLSYNYFAEFAKREVNGELKKIGRGGHPVGIP